MDSGNHRIWKLGTSEVLLIGSGTEEKVKKQKPCTWKEAKEYMEAQCS